MQYLSQYFKKLTDRPLLIFFPIYVLAVQMGWSLSYVPYLLHITLVLAVLAWLIIYFKQKYKVLAISILCFFLGFSLIQYQSQTPTDEYHVLNYMHSNNLEASYVLVGGYVLPTSGPVSEAYNLDLELNELILPGKINSEEKIEKVWGKIRIRVHEEVLVKSGDYVRLPVILKRVKGFKNPGGFNLDKYWGAQGFWVRGYLKSASLISNFKDVGQNSFMSNLRERAYNFIKKESYAPATGLLAAQLIGIRTSVDEKSEETFRNLGLSHILSVSGLHMGIWYIICFFSFNFILSKFLFLKLRFRINLLAAFLAIWPTIFYAYLVGGASPVIRSALMLLFAVASLFVLRKADGINVLLAVAWIIALIEPFRLLTISYQLSFVATFFLLLAFKRRQGEKPHKNFYYNSLKVAVVGSLSTAPIVAYYFAYVPIIGVLANLFFTTLLSFLVLPLGLLAVAIEPLCPFLATLALKIPYHGLMFIMPILDKLASFFGAGLFLPAPSLGFMFFFYVALIYFFRASGTLKKRLAISFLFCLLAIIVNDIYYEIKDPKSNILRFTVLDVGQGTAIHINLPDRKQMFIDGGGSFTFDPSEYIISQYLLRKNITQVDILALTHTDTDHLKGLITIAERFKAKEIWGANWPNDISLDYQRYLEIAQKNNSLQKTLKDLKDNVNFQGAEIEILWPLEDFLAEEKLSYKIINDYGVIYRIKYLGYSFLVTGDIGPQTENKLVEIYGETLASTVLLAPHHGSKNNLQVNFLASVKPKWVVFTAGFDNNYGLPNSKVVERAEEVAKVWRTDLSGAVVFEVKDNTFMVKSK